MQDEQPDEARGRGSLVVRAFGAPASASTRSLRGPLAVRALRALPFALAVSCGASQPPPVEPRAEPVAVVAEPEPQADEPEIRLVPQHAARGEDASAWDPITRTLVVVSSSGHLVLVDGATGLVRAVERFGRRADNPSLVVGAGRGFVFFETSEGEEVSAELDLDTGAVGSESSGNEAIASADASTLASWQTNQASEVHVVREEGDEAYSCDFAVPEEQLDRDPDTLTVGLSDDGKLLVVGAGTSITIVDTRECTQSGVFELPSPPEDAAIFEDGRTAILLDRHHAVIRDARSGALEEPIELGAEWWSIAFVPDGRTIAGRTSSGVVGVDLETRAATRLDASTLAAAFARPIDGAMPEHDFVGGEHAVHAAWIRPDAEGLLIGQREGTVLVSRDGARVVDCLDGEQELDWSPLEPGVALQGDDGHCNVGTGEGTPPSPEPGYGSYYEDQSSGDEEEEADAAPEDEVFCAPSDPGVCMTFPGRGPPRLRATADSRGHVIRGAGDAEVSFSTDARYVVLTTSATTRIVDVATGRDRLRIPHARVVDWSPEEDWVITEAGGGSATFRSVDDSHVSFDVARGLRAESIVFEPGGTNALLCTASGIERLSIPSGALSSLAVQPCETIRIFGEHAVVHAPHDTQAHVVDLASGSVLLDFLGTARPPPAGSTFFHLPCEGAARTVVDVARATTATIERSCGHTATAEDGSYWISDTSFEGVTLGRPDGATIALRVIWVGGEPHPYVEAADHAFWVAAEDVGELNVVAERDDTFVVTSAADPEMQRRFYRPTLLADFLDGRPLPEASR